MGRSCNNIIVALVGESASGKDSVGRVLANQYGYKYVVSTTTRPMRSNERNHVDYHFIDEDEFQQLVDNDELVEYRYYDTIENSKPSRWHYGIERKEIDLADGSYIAVVDLKGLKDLQKEYGNRVISIYIKTPEELRRLRAIARDRNFEDEEFQRRLEDDKVKFANVYDAVDEIVENIDLDKCVKEVVFKLNYCKSLIKFYEQYSFY